LRASRGFLSNTSRMDSFLAVLCSGYRDWPLMHFRSGTERARTLALDPALSATDVATTRRDMEDAAFRRDRMQEAVRRLGEGLRDVRRQEGQSQRRPPTMPPLRSAISSPPSLTAVYPALAEQLAEVMARIAANDALIERVNRKSLPDRADRLQSAEAMARGVRGFVSGGVHIPRITEQLRLPSFQYSGRDQYTWPRSQQACKWLGPGSMLELAASTRAALRANVCNRPNRTCERWKGGRVLTHKRHWMCTAAMILIPV
jgi:hypothetical protein